MLLVDDSTFFRKTLAGSLNGDPAFEVVGEAGDPYEARQLIMKLRPDVMTLDVEMPRMNGVDFLKILMPQWPLPIVIVSSARALASECRRFGAFDFVPKPTDYSGGTLDDFLSHVRNSLYRAARARLPAEERRTAGLPEMSAEPATEGAFRFSGIVALGASTGGTKSTTQILRALPKDFPGMVIVQHMPNEFTRLYAESVNRESVLEVREARNGDRVESGHVLIAPGDAHMELVRTAVGGYAVQITRGEKVNGHRPSVDVLFRSVARWAGANAVGIILTGMGADGARGLLDMRRHGAFTIGQDEKSSVVYGMPKEAYEMGAVTRQWPLDQIAPGLLRYVREMKY